ncbi:uncharacterized protein LOC115890743 [Sitophilus oryzae]|uniref:Uncharacterized protein LOC115890743 n=1 Tax=Sitophilus oryzae TaxID=7048 RepID=A0A6J2YUR7_SITOR|nr:uncharacterized protein LOC115890743 [Sitophilus oryzae]
MVPQKCQHVNVNISELTLTPYITASLINEIIKGLIYQKCQIPFPYSWLKTVVEKKRKCIEGNIKKRVNITYENHFRMVSTAYDTINLIMKGITKELSASDNVLEIIIIFGSTPHCPKEIFTLNVPSVVKEHNEKNHITELNKNLQKVLRQIFLSQSWMDSIDCSVSCTNTYIYLKKKSTTSDHINSEIFELCEPLEVSQNVRCSDISFNCKTSGSKTCCEVYISKDSDNNSEPIFKEPNPNCEQIVETPTNLNQKVTWCRSKNVFKGFKDIFVNKISVCELW